MENNNQFSNMPNQPAPMPPDPLQASMPVQPSGPSPMQNQMPGQTPNPMPNQMPGQAPNPMPNQMSNPTYPNQMPNQTPMSAPTANFNQSSPQQLSKIIGWVTMSVSLFVAFFFYILNFLSFNNSTATIIVEFVCAGLALASAVVALIFSIREHKFFAWQHAVALFLGGFLAIHITTLAIKLIDYSSQIKSYRYSLVLPDSESYLKKIDFKISNLKES